jgi:hypothetical protein
VILYHFTSTTHLPRILRTEYLKTVESNIAAPPYAHVGPDVVWLLDTPTCDYPHGLLKSSVDKQEIRFTVDVPGIRWLDWPPVAKMELDWRRALLKAAGGEDAAAHWYVYPRRIPAKRWVEIRNVKRDQEVVYEWAEV